MKRFYGMMPSDEIELSKFFLDKNENKLRIDAGPNGYTITWYDGSTNYCDITGSTEGNMDIAISFANKENGPITEIHPEISEEVEEAPALEEDNEESIFDIDNPEIVETWSEEFKKQVIKLIEDEIEDTDGNIRNNRLWEMAYVGEGPNPHTANICFLNEYKKRLNFYANMIRHISI